MYCLRVVLLTLWIGVAIAAADALLDGRLVLGGVLLGVSFLVLGVEWIAGTIAERVGD